MDRGLHVGWIGNPFARNFNVSPATRVPLLHRDLESGELEFISARWGLVPSRLKVAGLTVASYDEIGAFSARVNSPKTRTPDLFLPLA